MTMTNQPNPPATANVDGDLTDIEAAIGRVRAGALTESAAFDVIGRIIERRAAPAEIYQKPWG